MLKVLNQLLGFTPNIIDSPVFSSANEIIAWHCNIIDPSKKVPIGGGCGLNKDLARRIATAEVIERALFQKIKTDQILSQEFYFNEFPTTSGFAAGFEEAATRNRAICEGIERWCFSQWIDHHKKMHFITESDLKFSTLASHFKKAFDQVHFYQSPEFNFESKRLRVLIAVAYKDHGVFVGSRCSNQPEDLINHALLEAHRNMTTFQNHKILDEKEIQSFFMKRLIFFGTNAKIAEEQMAQAKDDFWPELEILLIKQLQLENVPYFLWRAIFKNWTSWHLGPDSRFVY